VLEEGDGEGDGLGSLLGLGLGAGSPITELLYIKYNKLLTGYIMNSALANS
jgi:hypothetical protein